MSGCVRRISPRRGFDPQTVDPLESRCKDNAISARTVHGTFAEDSLTRKTGAELHGLPFREFLLI